MANEACETDHNLTTYRVPEDGICYFWGHRKRRIKIGATSHPDMRARTLRYQFGFGSFLAIVPGGERVEREYHARFAEHRLGKAEMFAPHPDILAEIDRLTSPSPEPRGAA